MLCIQEESVSTFRSGLGLMLASYTSASKKVMEQPFLPFVSLEVFYKKVEWSAWIYQGEIVCKQPHCLLQ